MIVSRLGVRLREKRVKIFLKTDTQLLKAERVYSTATNGN